MVIGSVSYIVKRAQVRTELKKKSLVNPTHILSRACIFLIVTLPQQQNQSQFKMSSSCNAALNFYRTAVTAAQLNVSKEIFTQKIESNTPVCCPLTPSLTTDQQLTLTRSYKFMVRTIPLQEQSKIPSPQLQKSISLRNSIEHKSEAKPQQTDTPCHPPEHMKKAGTVSFSITL